MKSFNLKSLTAWTLLPAALLLAGCFDSPNNTKEEDDDLVIPASYAFNGPGDSSSVEYGGQTVRLLLIADIQSAARVPSTANGVAIAPSEILKYYNHADADSLTIRTNLADSSKQKLFTKYPQIMGGRKLSDKVSPDTVIGYGITTDSLVRQWAATISANSQNTAKLKTTAVYHDSNGVDLSQMISKVLAGAVAYYQATAVYLTPVTTKDNVALVGGKNYTQMEHNWDEAFGYFGAARNYNEYTDDQMNTGGAAIYRDDNADGKIDFRSEYNFSMMGRYTARRDRGIAGQDWSGDAFLAFRKGRALITAKRSNAEIAAEAVKAAGIWEKVFAANTIVYIKSTKSILATVPDTGLSTSLSGNWSEMKAFAICLQYSPYRTATNAQLAQLQHYLGKYPVRGAGKTAYIEKLDSALALVKSIHGFSDAQVNSTGW